MSMIHCSYITTNGTTAYTYCSIACCEGDVQSEGEACCELNTFTGLYLGVSIGTVSIVGFLCLCLACICFKEKIFKKQAIGSQNPFTTNTSSNPWTSSQTDFELAVFKGPPAYETLEFPPPYVLFSPISNNSTVVPNTVNQTEPELPDIPPPEYTEYATTDS